MAGKKEVRGFDKRSPNGDRSVRVLFLLCIAIAARAWQFGNPVLHVDDQFYLLVGDRIWAGALPYVDIWDRKPIGLFLIYAAIRALPGDGVWAYQLVATLFAAATAWVVAGLADRVASRGAALAAGAAYLLWLGAFGGDGGQAPVFYNVLVALAALLVVRVAEGAAAFRHGCTAMALVGAAMQVKYTAVFEGVFFGSVLLWHARRDRRVVAMAACWVGIALLPTALAWSWYGLIGHGRDFSFANFTSIFERGGDGAGESALRLMTMAAKLSPLLLAVAVAVTRRRGSVAGLLFGWGVAAGAGVLLFGTYWDHYALPLLAPLCVLAAPALAKWRNTLGAVVLIAGTAQSANAIVKHRHQRGDGAVAREIAAFAKPRLHGGCLFVFDGDPWLYAMTASCLPTTRPFPDHLDNFRENNATGLDTRGEVARVMRTRPSVVIVSGAPEPKSNIFTRRIVRDALARDYRPMRVWRVGKRTRVAFVRD